MKYHVRYYDAKLSKKGKGTQVAAFKTRAEAEDFAGRNQIYSMPCRVELVAEEGDDDKMADLERRLAKIAKACLAPVNNTTRIDLVQDALIGLGIRELIDAHP